MCLRHADVRDVLSIPDAATEQTAVYYILVVDSNRRGHSPRCTRVHSDQCAQSGSLVGTRAAPPPARGYPTPSRAAPRKRSHDPQAAPRPVARGVHLALGRHREQRLLATHQLHGPEHADGLALGGDLDLQ